MKWEQDVYTTNYICPYCGNMVRDDGYGECDYSYCPYCGEQVEPTIDEEKMMYV